MMAQRPGFGLGLRRKHIATVLETLPAVDWFEVVTEDYMEEGSANYQSLLQINKHYPLVLHGVSLSIGGTDPLDIGYLKQLKHLIKMIQPKWVSDHLCWTGIDGLNTHDLLPLPYNEESLIHVAQRVRDVQSYLSQRILLENVSSYVSFKGSTMSEWQFLNALAEEADCDILLDINNIYVNAFNHQFDPVEYLQAISPARVKQFHLAGHKQCQTHLLDTHDRPIIAEVWELYRQAIHYFPQAELSIERDADIPEFNELFAELETARIIYEEEITAREKIA